MMCCQKYGWVHADCCRNKVQEGATIRLIRQFHEGPRRVFHLEENHGRMVEVETPGYDSGAEPNLAPEWGAGKGSSSSSMSAETGKGSSSLNRSAETGKGKAQLRAIPIMEETRGKGYFQQKGKEPEEIPKEKEKGRNQPQIEPDGFIHALDEEPDFRISRDMPRSIEEAEAQVEEYLGGPEQMKFFLRAGSAVCVAMIAMVMITIGVCETASTMIADRLHMSVDNNISEEVTNETLQSIMVAEDASSLRRFTDGAIGAISLFLGQLLWKWMKD